MFQEYKVLLKERSVMMTIVAWDDIIKTERSSKLFNSVFLLNNILFSIFYSSCRIYYSMGCSHVPWQWHQGMKVRYGNIKLASYIGDKYIVP